MKLLRKLALFRKASPRRTLIAGLLMTAVLAIGGTVPANASTVSSQAKFTAAASPLQDKVLDAALARVPGGTRISAGEAEWDGGRIVLGVTAPGTAAASSPDATLTCEPGLFCAWGAKNEEGSCWMSVAGGSLLEFDWAAYSGNYCGSVGTWSWANETSYRVWKEQSYSGNTYDAPYLYSGGKPSGASYCIDPDSANEDVTDATVRTLGWIYASDNTSYCPS